MYYFNIFTLVFCMVACSSKPTVQDANNDSTTTNAAVQPAKDSITKGVLINRVACANDATQSFALYIPMVQNNATMPVIVCFDPHADGALPLKKYKALADAYHFILIGSNNSKNGNDWNISQQIWNTLYNDIQSRLPADKNRLYTCGFSGGAKVASFIALHQGNITGVVAAGAGLPEDQPIGNFSFSFTGMAGRGDMNMTDLVATNSQLDKTNTVHRLILFDGKHVWPPAEVMRTAFAGLQLDAMRSKIIAKNDSLIQAFAAGMQQQVDKDIAAKKWVQAQQSCHIAINMLTGLSAATGSFEKEINSITANPAYQQQVQTAQQLFAIEQSKKQIFQQQFQQGDMQYWTATINDLTSKAKAATTEGAMYQRLLAYLSLAFYSISNNLIQNNQNEPATYFVTLYKMADATNPEAWYFSALLNARSNNTKTAEADLIKAADNGFDDTLRLQQQPEFQTLSPQVNITLIESRMKKPE